MHANLLLLAALQREATSCHCVNKHQTVAAGHPTMQTIAQPADTAGRVAMNVQNAARARDAMRCAFFVDGSGNTSFLSWFEYVHLVVQRQISGSLTGGRWRRNACCDIYV